MKRETLAERSDRLEAALDGVRPDGGGPEGSEALCAQCAFDKLDLVWMGLLKGEFDSKTGIDGPVNCDGCGKAQFPPAWVWNFCREED